MAYLSDELSHAGVKGMKWGVRKNPRGGSSSSGRTPGRSKNGPSIKKLSDKQLDKKIARLKKEKELESLTGQEKIKIFNGKKVANHILESTTKNVATSVATTLLTAGALYGAKKLIEQKWGVEVKTELFPKKK